MKTTINILMDIAATLNSVDNGAFELNKCGYNISEIRDKMANNENALIEYLENERNQGHYKSPLIKKLELALMSAEDVINAAFKDADRNVCHDCGAVVDLCKEWIRTINEYYRYNPEPGTIAHAILESRKRLSDFWEQSKHQSSIDTHVTTKTANEFRSCLLIQDNKKDELLNKLHLLIDGKKGKPVALVIRSCVELGLMTKPTFGVLEAEFPGIGNKNGYNDYYRNYSTKYTEEDIKGIKLHLEPFLNLV